MVADTDAEDLITVGRVGRVFGTRGWIRVQSFTRPPGNLANYSPWILCRGNCSTTLEVLECRGHHGATIARLAGIETREAAEALVRSEIRVSREVFSPPDDDEYFWLDLIGLSVVNLDGRPLGQVKTLYETGAHDVLAVSGASEVLIPFVRNVFVVRVDMDGGQIVVDWPMEQ